MSEREARDPRAWWGIIHFDDDQRGRWRVGPTELWITRLKQEWRIAWETGDDPMDGRLEVELPGTGAGPESRANEARFGFTRTSSSLQLQPALPDRAVVTRPERLFYIPQGQEVLFYVSLPLWVQVRLGEPQAVLQEIALFRPSDTWLGPPTREGELCYAGTSAVCLKLDEIERCPHRAITAVLVRNRSRSKMYLERLKIPVTHLSLFSTDKAVLCTQTVTLTREQEGEMARIGFDTLPHIELGKADQIGSPREPLEKDLVTRAFGFLFR